MEFSFLQYLDKRKGAEALVLPFWKGNKQGEWAVALPSSISSAVVSALESGDFKGKEGEIQSIYVKDQPEKRFILLGLGNKEKVSVETVRRAYGNLTKTCIARKLATLNLQVPSTDFISEDDLIRGISEGLLLPNYKVGLYKGIGPEEEGPSLLQKVVLIGPHKHILDVAEKYQAIAEGVYYVRDLANSNSEDVTAQYLEGCARGIAKMFPDVKLTLFDKKRIEKEKMGLLLAVNKGSATDPAFIILEYRGNSKSKDCTVLVGKGITYDTGGLNIKSANMETMKVDMAGAAACLATLSVACTLEMKVNLTVVIPSTDNCVSATSFRPGDVYSSYAGKNVEVLNTDAEGRLILADAIAYAVKNLNPTRIIDIATLTGGIDIALGPEATALMSNDDALSAALLQAGEKTYERLWRMPLFEEYKDRLKSDIADLKSWNGRTAGPNVAATFLGEFAGNVPWAHLDIASTAYFSEARKYTPKYATGMGVRLFIEFLENL